MRSLVIATLFVGAYATFLPGVASAAPVDYSWSSAVSGDWSDPAMWTPTGVPGSDPGDTASITAATGVPYTVTGLRSLSAFTLDSLDATVLLSTAMQQVSVNGPYVFQNGTVACARLMYWIGDGTLTNNANMYIRDIVGVSCPFVQNGNLLIEGTAKSTFFSGAILSVRDVFTNAGTITLDSTGSIYSSAIVADRGVTLTNLGTIISAAGAGGSRAIEADIANDGEILIFADTTYRPAYVHTLTNRGLVHIASGRTLTVDGDYSDPIFNQDAGTLQIDGTLAIINGATFNYNGGTILGPVVFMQKNNDYSYLNIGTGAANPAEFIIRGKCDLGGDVHTGQTITIGSYRQGSSAFYGGELWLRGSHNNFGTITIGEYSGGMIGDTLVNAGVINVSTAIPQGIGFFYIDLINNGEVNVVTPVEFSKNNGEYVNNGEFRLHDTTMTLKQFRRFTNGPDGTFAGTGTIDVRETTYFPPPDEGAFMNEGTLAPGLSIGTLAIVGLQMPRAFAQSDSGILEIEIGQDGHDLLAITGAASLDGLLDVQLYDGFTPQLGDAFDVVTTTHGITDYGLALSPEGRGLWTMQYVNDGKTLRLACVPEPSVWVLLLLGVGAIPAIRRRQATAGR